MSTIFIILMVLQLATCGGLVVMILLQKKRASGLSGAVSGMGSGSTYWDKNKGRSFEGQLEKYTKICGLIFFILTILLSFVR